MTAHHHLDDLTLSRYAAGDLDEAFTLVASAHIAMCDLCSRGLRDAEEMGGELLEAVDTEDMAADSFEKLMDHLEEPAGVAATIKPKPGRRIPQEGNVPAPLRRHIGPWLDGVSWKPLAPGIRRHVIKISPQSSQLYMLHIAPGKAMPEHGHGGAEMTLVLSGAYRDNVGRFGPGDIADLDEDVEHEPTVEPGESCICIIAAEAPTRFKGIVGRILQPLIGI